MGNSMPGARCPNCRETMQPVTLRGALRAIEIDACFPCHTFWFDPMESSGLSDASVLDVFRMIHENRNSQRRTIEIGRAHV